MAGWTLRKKACGRVPWRGVTLVELLVVLVIIVIHAGPPDAGHQFWCEAANRAHCKSNLHQLGVAAQLYLNTRRKLPDPPVSGTMSGWAIEILPFIEETALADGLSGSPLNSATALALAANRSARHDLPVSLRRRQHNRRDSGQHITSPGSFDPPRGR